MAMRKVNEYVYSDNQQNFHGIIYKDKNVLPYHLRRAWQNKLNSQDGQAARTDSVPFSVLIFEG